MKRPVHLLLIACSLMACSTEGVQKKYPQGRAREERSAESTVPGKKRKKALNSDDLAIQRSKTFENGIAISWMQKGKGAPIKKGDVINIDFKVTLEDGKVVDGNHLWKKESFPFVVGFKMQTEGWDLALQHLKVGDFARIKIPGNLGRKEGIKMEGKKEWYLPPNAVNYLSIHVLEKMKPTRSVDGVRVYVFEENKKNKEKFNENNAIIFHSMISSESNPYYYNSYRLNSPYTLYMTDKGIIPGLKKALINAKKADRMYVIVPSLEAYGEKGSEGFVKPNEDLLYNLFVMDVVPK
jgi:FKBP-type peptidyl-prolyl cis-trans isomerase